MKASTSARVFACALSIAAAGAAQAQDKTVLYEDDRVTLRWHLQAGLYVASEGNVFWDLASVSAPGSGFDPDKSWQETYVKPGLSFDYKLDSGQVLYGKFSAVASYTNDIDPFDEGNQGASTIEEAYLGLKGSTAGGLSYDVSLGARELRLGTGMIIANGATSGFERGTLKFGPRKAWERSVILRLSKGGVSGTAFFLDPNELPSTNGENELAGVDVRYDAQGGGYLGATYARVLNSTSPYPQAAPGGLGAPSVTPGARDGTETLALYAKTNAFEGAFENWTFTADLAVQRNDRIDLEAWAGRLQASYAFTDIAWSPTVTLAYQTFSGDDPNTTTLERFDPLYYEGSPAAWATGSKSASTFINSNVNAFSLAVRAQPSPRDTVTFRYAHIRANELLSPVQFGQATRVDVDGNVVSGVTDAHLADDVYLEYNRVLNRNTFVSAGLAMSYPGAGIKAARGGAAPTWTGAYVNIVFNY